jgi:hypothetical protein
MSANATLNALPDLATLRVSNGALRSEQLPARMKILNWGDNPSTKGNFRVGPRTVAVLQANQSALGFDRIAIDYNHASAPGAPDYVKGAVPPIFGYGRPTAIENDGVYLEDITWTPLGAEKARNFEDLSPALHPSKPGEEVEFVHSVALTTNGALKDVTFFSATNDSDKTNMSTQTVQFLSLVTLASAIGLPATASETDVTTKLKKLTDLEPLSALLKDGKVVLVDDLATLNSTVTDLKSQVANLSSQLSALQSGADGRERTNILTLLSSEGKVPKNADGKPYTAEELAKTDVPTLKLLYANTPATVPLSARGKQPAEKQSDPNLTGSARAASAWDNLEK